ncbi:MAG TPA: type II toxin-antitoxin system RelE/ParE family toxin [Thermoanaerobaculia bacterium]|jgi:mRNA interferase RelE/StbE|nr:type II toxin-antitoxin system RelE/ParE family toxin [Thermoanaerobaculia bacterium]
MAEVVLTRRALRDLKGLDTQTRNRVLERLQQAALDPLQNSIKLTAARLGTYRYRVGDYRIIFDFEGDTVIVLRIGNRKDIYS